MGSGLAMPDDERWDQALADRDAMLIIGILFALQIVFLVGILMGL